MKRIIELHKEIVDTLFTITPPLNYDELAEKFVELSNAIMADNSDDESLWYVGEHTAATLDVLMIGAFWHYTEWHSGQDSDGYMALSAIGEVFTPGMSCPPEDESEPEFETYSALEALARISTALPTE